MKRTPTRPTPFLPNWRYEPSGDIDGNQIGTDHLVMEGDRQIACAPDEKSARLIAAAPDMLRALLTANGDRLARVAINKALGPERES